jgi:STE24 endopeptidase
MRFLLALLWVSFLLGAQTGTAFPTLHIPPGAEAGPGFDAETATKAYLATWKPSQKARSDAYFEGGYWLLLWNVLIRAAIAILLLATRLSAKFRDWSARITSRKPLATWLYWAQYSLAIFILGFPGAVYEGFVRESQYGFMNQTFAGWLTDRCKWLAVDILLGGIAVVALFGIVRRLQRTWQFWGAGAAIVFTMIGALIYPVFLAPLFNKYTLLEDASIRDPILRIARENGIPATKVYEVDASRQTKRVSANVSGLLGTERITLNDNLLRRCSPQAIMAVMGHEMGHYVLNHIYKMMAFLTILFVGYFAALRWSLERSLTRWGAKWQIGGVGDTAVLPLATLILSIIAFAATPIQNTLVRTQEYEADIFGLNAARQPDGTAEAALLLGEYRKMEPSALEEFLFFDHPSGRTRIYSAMRWKAENQCLGNAVNPCERFKSTANR